MSDGDGGARTKKPIRVLKDRVGGTRPEVTERNKRHRRLRKAIRAALAEGPRTVPDLATEVGVPTHETLFMLMAMKKYGEVGEGEERDDYFEYALLDVEAEQ